MKKAILLLLATTFLIFACDRTSDIVNPESEYTDLAAYMESNEVEAEVSTIDASVENTISTESGSSVNIPANSCVDANGNPITGDVEVAITEIYDASGAILNDMPTITEDGQLLESGGEFVIDITQDGEEVFLADGASINLEVAAANAGVDTEGMGLYVGVEDEDGNFSWVEVDEAALDCSSSDCFSGSIGWTGAVNIDKPIDTEPIEVDVVIPTTAEDTDITKENTQAYIVFEELNSTLPMTLDEEENEDVEGTRFYVNNMPTNQEFSIVVVHYKGEEESSKDSTEEAFQLGTESELIVTTENLSVELMLEDITGDGLKEVITALSGE